MANVVFFTVLVVIVLVSAGVWILFKAMVLNDPYDYNKFSDTDQRNWEQERESKLLAKDSSRNSSSPESRR